MDFRTHRRKKYTKNIENISIRTLPITSQFTYSHEAKHTAEEIWKKMSTVK